MNTASLKLCKQLYELSGWENTEKTWFEFSDGTGVANNSLKPEQYKRWICRAYDLGFLLRKLPFGLVITKPLEGMEDYHAVYVPENDPILYEAWEDTPENAACSLAVSLFEQGILTREEQS